MEAIFPSHRQKSITRHIFKIWFTNHKELKYKNKHIWAKSRKKI